MKSVVILAPDFSPSGHPPALRARFFARHLPEFGWTPIIVATDPRYYETAVDEENEKLLPPDVTVVRTRAIPARLTRRMRLWSSEMANYSRITPILFKGAATLATAALPYSASKLMSDLDIMVRPEQIEATMKALVAIGYSVHYQSRPDDGRWHTDLVRSSDVGMVDLQLEPPGHAFFTNPRTT